MSDVATIEVFAIHNGELIMNKSFDYGYRCGDSKSFWVINNNKIELRVLPIYIIVRNAFDVGV